MMKCEFCKENLVYSYNSYYCAVRAKDVLHDFIYYMSLSNNSFIERKHFYWRNKNNDKDFVIYEVDYKTNITIVETPQERFEFNSILNIKCDYQIIKDKIKKLKNFS